jgi:hypothetical protein
VFPLEIFPHSGDKNSREPILTTLLSAPQNFMFVTSSGDVCYLSDLFIQVNKQFTKSFQPLQDPQILETIEIKIWRQPTLAEAIQPLPSARLCLTAEFGKGSGRATALWSPKNCI